MSPLLASRQVAGSARAWDRAELQEVTEFLKAEIKLGRYKPLLSDGLV